MGRRKMIQKIIQLANNPVTHTIVLILLVIAVAILVFCHIRQYFNNRIKKFYSKINTPSLIGIYVVIILLIGFAVYAIYHVGIKYNNYLDTLKATGFAADDIAKLSIFDMQANTLAISTLVVTIASIVLTILTLYKDRKAEINSQRLEESRIQIQQAEEAIKNLSNIVSLTFVQENQRECYFDAVNQLIDQNSTNNSPFYNHFRIAQIGLLNNVIADKQDDISMTPTYEKIIEIAEQIINSGDVTELDSQFAYLEALHALYLKIKNGVQTNMQTVQEDIRKAFKYIKKVDVTLEDDSYGHVANLNALTHYWSGMYKIRHGESTEGKHLFDVANRKIDEALEKNKNKVEFLNHKAVILQQIYDISGGEQLFDELMSIYADIRKNTNRYPKTNLNYASALLRSVKNKARMEMLDQFPDFSKYNGTPGLNQSDYDEMLKTLKEAKDILRKNIENAPRLINNFYKLGEVITIQYAIQKYGSNNLKEKPAVLKKEAIEAFAAAKQLSDKSIPCKLCECAFCRLVGDTENADSLQNELKKSLDKKPAS